MEGLEGDAGQWVGEIGGLEGDLEEEPQQAPLDEAAYLEQLSTGGLQEEA